MKAMRRLGAILLGLWLIVTGLSQVITIDFPYKTVIMAVVAIVAGVLVLFSKVN